MMVQVAVIGFAAVCLAIQFRSGKSEYATYISLVACILIFSYGIDKIESVLRIAERLKQYLGVNSGYIRILLKIVGITYLSEFASALCRDAGYGAIAGQIELVGKLSILTVSMPIILALLDTIGELL